MRRSGFSGIGFMISLLLLAIGCLLVLPPVFKSIHFNNYCGGYLERAAEAPTPEIAKESLDIAIKYLIDNGLTNGTTWIMIPNVNNDLGWFSRKVFAARGVMDELNANSKPLEVSNVMMRMRESLVKQGEKSEKVILPDWISIHPNQTLWVVFGTIGWILLFFSACGMFVSVLES